MVSCALSGVQMRPRTNSGHSLSRFSVPLLPKPQPVVLDPSDKLASIRENYLLVTVVFLSPSAEKESCEKICARTLMPNPLPPHPFAALFPELPPEELTQLARDIKERGQLEPIILYKGVILDGRNRYRACQIAGVKTSD
jgi:hypothetical protein